MIAGETYKNLTDTNDVAVSPSDGDIMYRDDTNSDYRFKSPLSAGWVYLGEDTGDNTGDLVIDSVVTSSYDTYRIELNALLPATDNTGIEFILRDSGGDISGTYISGFRWLGLSGTGAGGSVNNTGTNGFYLAGAIGNVVGEGFQGRIIMRHPDTAAPTIGTYEGISTQNTGLSYHHRGGLLIEDTSTVTGFSVKFVSGNVKSGQAKIYGLRNA
jgi:hypothetical protein